MFIDFLIEQFNRHKDKDALVWNEQSCCYATLLIKINEWREFLSKKDLQPGTVVMIQADYSPNSVALLLALIEAKAIIVPLTESVVHKKSEFIEVSQTQVLIEIDGQDAVSYQVIADTADHEHIICLKQRQVPGLILFSSGSTGKSKAAIHDLKKLLEKFKLPRHAFRSIPFLLYDHIGGFNTLLYTLANAGCLVVVADRKPDTVLQAIEQHAVELLPTSPTFINLVLLSESYQKYDLSSLKTVTYGTEPMPESTLTRFHALFPQIKLLQTYGLSELGILRSKSESSTSLWMKVGGEGFQTRITDDNILQIKADSGMLGYLNAASPYTEDGWFHTGDLVEQKGDYIRVLGRQSEIINVGGLKVYPAEIESVLLQLNFVAEAEVYGEKNALIGQVVCARIRLNEQMAMEDKKAIKTKIKQHCKNALESYQIPAKIKFDEHSQFSARFKKQRTLSGGL
ncbi:ANL family adenylate-forming protein [Gayadomonas joobiniege]|uniref:ANL family adenylate-forming protein n=1 Tax=Gayadomonas joobiniege TaxID=1234606 RepID=UPI000375B2DF|nr:fatty acid--CoA ligase family protein [Gayadomonas joobiniege]